MKVTEDMSRSDAQKKSVSSKLNELLENELIKTLLLMCLVVVSVLIFRTALVASLETEYPLHTPISPSMEPTLNIGDLLILQGVADSEKVNAHPENGDIIVFRQPTNPDVFIVHRAIGKSQDLANGEYYLRTKGDNNSSADPWKVTEDHLIGKVVWRIPLLGYIKIFLGTPVGMVVTLILFLVLFFLEAREPKEE